MGTRNLTAVYVDGEYKIAQYGQWDGYPEGNGLVCLEFLRDKCDMTRFREAVRRCRFETDEEALELDEECAKSPSQFFAKYPQLSRNMGSGVLEYVYSRTEPTILADMVDFAADGLFCEYAWVIDLDTGTFEGYEGFNKTPLIPDDRFYFLRDKEEGNGYHGVRLAASWRLDNLPTNQEFLSAFQAEDEEK